MPTILPSQIVDAIDEMFGPNRNELDLRKVHYKLRPQVHALLILLDEVPSELIDLSSVEYVELARCRGALATALAMWNVGGVQPAEQVGGRDPVANVRRLMAQCRDYVPPAAPELPFIVDDDVRLGLEDRIQAAWTDFHADEWMGATVLAGHVVEALLLWAVKNKGSTISNSDLDRLDLKGLTIEAAKLGLIKSDTLQQAELARDARNLIHPGKAKRSGAACNKATALQALAAVYKVADDLKSSA